MKTSTKFIIGGAAILGVVAYVRARKAPPAAPAASGGAIVDGMLVPPTSSSPTTLRSIVANAKNPWKPIPTADYEGALRRY